ncbi:MAG: hypothetical protein ACM34N_07460 [Ignavibacteria bacterium]
MKFNGFAVKQFFITAMPVSKHAFRRAVEKCFDENYAESAGSGRKNHGKY